MKVQTQKIYKNKHRTKLKGGKFCFYFHGLHKEQHKGAKEEAFEKMYRYEIEKNIKSLFFL